MAQDSMGEITNNPARSPALLATSKPHRKTFAVETFGKPEAYKLVARLANLWPSLVAEPSQEHSLAAEYLAQFDGYDIAKVDEAVTNAIGKRTRRDGAPAPGDIKAEVRALHLASPEPQRRAGPEHRHDYSSLPDEIRLHPEHKTWGGPLHLMSMNVPPEYIIWRHKERLLTMEAASKMKAMSAERYRELVGSNFANGFKPAGTKLVEPASETVSDASDSLRNLMAKRAA